MTEVRERKPLRERIAGFLEKFTSSGQKVVDYETLGDKMANELGRFYDTKKVEPEITSTENQPNKGGVRRKRSEIGINQEKETGIEIGER